MSHFDDEPPTQYTLHKHYEIKKKAPKPKPVKEVPRYMLYPFSKMKPDDYFIESGTDQEQQQVRSAANYYAKKHGRRFGTKRIQLCKGGRYVMEVTRLD